MPNPLNIHDITEEQKNKLFDQIKEKDWVFAPFNENGEKNKEFLDYCAMNTLAMKYNEDKGEFEDYRVLESNSNEMCEAFNVVDPPDASYAKDLVEI